MNYLVRALVKYSASDMHIKVGRPPLFRINGNLVPARMPELMPDQIERILGAVMTASQVADLERRRSIDFSFGIRACGRFRCNVYYQRGSLSAAVRMIPLAVPSLDHLGLPPVLKELCLRPRGLVLVTGPTGSGKSTTLAAMVNYINEHRQSHILTIEDPIEFLHRDIKATVSQREIGSDAMSAGDALHEGLRQDPDVIMISEVRSHEMIQTALTAAETGHLVLTTLHTSDAKGSIDRIMDAFPPEGRAHIRNQIASTLAGVISQQLLQRASGEGRVCACEVMIKSPTIENLILKNELDKIPDTIAQSGDYYKMQSMNSALERLARERVITVEDAIRASTNAADLQLRFSGMDRTNGYDTGTVRGSGTRTGRG